MANKPDPKFDGDNRCYAVEMADGFKPEILLGPEKHPALNLAHLICHAMDRIVSLTAMLAAKNAKTVISYTPSSELKERRARKHQLP